MQNTLIKTNPFTAAAEALQPTFAAQQTQAAERRAEAFKAHGIELKTAALHALAEYFGLLGVSAPPDGMGIMAQHKTGETVVFYNRSGSAITENGDPEQIEKGTYTATYAFPDLPNIELTLSATQERGRNASCLLCATAVNGKWMEGKHPGLRFAANAATAFHFASRLKPFSEEVTKEIAATAEKALREKLADNKMGSAGEAKGCVDAYIDAIEKASVPKDMRIDNCTLAALVTGYIERADVRARHIATIHNYISLVSDAVVAWAIPTVRAVRANHAFLKALNQDQGEEPLSYQVLRYGMAVQVTTEDGYTDQSTRSETAWLDGDGITERPDEFRCIDPHNREWFLLKPWNIIGISSHHTRVGKAASTPYVVSIPVPHPDYLPYPRYDKVLSKSSEKSIRWTERAIQEGMQETTKFVFPEHPQAAQIRESRTFKEFANNPKSLLQREDVRAFLAETAEPMPEIPSEIFDLSEEDNYLFQVIRLALNS